jgi:hypothetical protein
MTQNMPSIGHVTTRVLTILCAALLVALVGLIGFISLGMWSFSNAMSPDFSKKDILTHVFNDPALKHTLPFLTKEDVYKYKIIAPDTGILRVLLITKPIVSTSIETEIYGFDFNTFDAAVTTLDKRNLNHFYEIRIPNQIKNAKATSVLYPPDFNDSVQLIQGDKYQCVIIDYYDRNYRFHPYVLEDPITD